MQHIGEIMKEMFSKDISTEEFLELLDEEIEKEKMESYIATKKIHKTYEEKYGKK